MITLGAGATEEQKKKVQEIFDRAAFVVDLGVQLEELSPGRCVTSLEIAPRHLQQDRFIHAGVQATMADHTAGAAAASLAAPDEGVLSVEYKINMLRPAIGDRLRCVSTVLRPGKTLSVVESEVYASTGGGEEKLVSKATVTLALVRPR